MARVARRRSIARVRVVRSPPRVVVRTRQSPKLQARIATLRKTNAALRARAGKSGVQLMDSGSTALGGLAAGFVGTKFPTIGPVPTVPALGVALVGLAAYSGLKGQTARHLANLGNGMLAVTAAGFGAKLGGA